MIQTVPLNALLASWLPLFLSHLKVKIIILKCYISLKTVLKCFVNLITFLFYFLAQKLFFGIYIGLKFVL